MQSQVTGQVADKMAPYAFQTYKLKDKDNF